MELQSAVERWTGWPGRIGGVRYPEYLGLALHTLAAHSSKWRILLGAGRDLERSLSLLEPLYRANPRQLTRLRDLADCYQVFGDLPPATRIGSRRTPGTKEFGTLEQAGSSWVAQAFTIERHDFVERLVAKAARNAGH